MARLGPRTTRVVLESASVLPAEARRQVLSGLPGFGAEAVPPVAEALPAMEEEVAVDVLAAVASMPPPLLVDVWDIAAEHAAPAVASAGRSRQAPPGTFSWGRALAALGGNDAARRSLALEFLGRHPTPMASGALEALAGSDRFRQLALEEKKALLLTLAQVDPAQALSTARRLFAQKSLLGGQGQDEVRAAAAVALGELGDRESRSAVEQARLGRASQLLKDACQQALQRIDQKARGG